MTQEVVVASFDEIALKRGRRPYYEQRLLTGITNSLRDYGPPKIEWLCDRVILSGGKTEIPAAVLADRVSRVFGVRYLLTGYAADPDVDGLHAAIRCVIASRPDARTFGVRVRGRPPAAFPGRRLELAGEIGAWIEGEWRLAVDLTSPDLWIEVVFLGPRLVVAGRRIEGPGGLPVGTSGQAVALVSGGIDSPVATWMMMGRGLRTSILHFHSAPFTSAASQEKVRRLAGMLTRYQPTIWACFVPFADLQRTLAASTPSRLRVLLYRRFMIRIAEVLARRIGAGCLVTGDALAQVASQTVANIAAIDAVATLPVLRPLIGMSKPEVIAAARRLGTYEASIEPHDDCCAFLLPERVAAAATASELAEAERDLPVADLVAAAIARREVFSVRFEHARAEVARGAGPHESEAGP